MAGRAGADRSSPHPSIARDRRPVPRPRSRRRTGVLLGSGGALGDPSATLPVPWTETAVAAVAATAIGPVEIHCLHVPNAANGWVKPHTLRAVRAGLDVAPPMPRVVCGDLNTPRRELENGEVTSFARDSRGRLRPERGSEWDEAELGVVPGLASSATGTPSVRCTATGPASRAGPGSESQVTAGAGGSTTCSFPPSWISRPAPTTTPGVTTASAITRRWRPTWSASIDVPALGDRRPGLVDNAHARSRRAHLIRPVRLRRRLHRAARAHGAGLDRQAGAAPRRAGARPCRGRSRPRGRPRRPPGGQPATTARRGRGWRRPRSATWSTSAPRMQPDEESVPRQARAGVLAIAGVFGALSALAAAGKRPPGDAEPVDAA